LPPTVAATHVAWTQKLRPIGLLLFLAFSYACASLARVVIQTSNEDFDPRNDVGFYYSEAAVQYRYARMVARGQPIPSVDRKLQYPEGVQVSRQLTVLMEYVAGWTYRVLSPVFGHPNFHVFLVFWTSFFLSLAVPLVFAQSSLLFRSPIAGVFASILYGFSVPSADRLSFGYETFTLPFIFGHLLLFCLATNGPENPTGCAPRWKLAAVGSGLCLAVALAAWHFTRFYYSSFVAACLGWYLVSGQVSRSDRFPWCFGTVTAASAIAGLAVPVLREKHFIVSPPLLAAVALTAALAMERLRTPKSIGSNAWRRLGALAVAALPMVIVFAVFGRESEGYEHVYDLLLQKLLQFGVKPDSPAALPFPARVLWVGAFDSPPLDYLVTGFLLPSLFATLALVRIPRPWRWFLESPQRFVPAVVGSFFVLSFLLVERLSVFAIYFISVCAGGVAWNIGVRRSRVLLFLAFPLALVLTSEFLNFREGTGFDRIAHRWFAPAASVRMPKWRFHDLDLVGWVRRHTSENSVFLARFGVGPLVLAYADRAIVLQPKFEAESARRKTQEFLAALYASEADLTQYCEKNEVDYYLLDVSSALDASKEGDRYVADALRLRKDTPAFLLQFAPEKLRHFELVFENSFYRVFRFHKGEWVDKPQEFPYQPIYDLAAFGGQKIDDRPFDDHYTGAVVASMERAVQIFRSGVANYESGQPALAIDDFRRAVAIYPSLVGVHGYLGMSLAAIGRLDEALEACQEEMQLSPEEPTSHVFLGDVRYLSQDYLGADKAWHEAQRLDPDYPGINERLSRPGVKPAEPARRGQP
jgi:tetratricopeptide (TPR) repeat protein